MTRRTSAPSLLRASFRTLAILALLAFVALPAWSGDYEKPAMDIVETAVSAGTFETLVTAVQAAGLVDTLKGEGPFTVFAPTDEAFAKLPAGTIEALLADKTKLVEILTYHVVAGKVMAKDVVALTEAPTVEGRSLAIDTSDGVKVDGANVVTTDIETSNGVIHVVDTVLIPSDS